MDVSKLYIIMLLHNGVSLSSHGHHIAIHPQALIDSSNHRSWYMYASFTLRIQIWVCASWLLGYTYADATC